MNLYSSVGPNPRAVRMFAAERGAALQIVKVDLRGGENGREALLKNNPSGQTRPWNLKLDFGAKMEQPFSNQLSTVPAWFARLHARPAASA